MGEPQLADTRSEVFGRYVLYDPIARGGMATVHMARLIGAEGFSRIVAAKKLHEQYTEDADFVTMFLDEAKIASKIHHPNVVPVLDVVLSGTDVVLVQEYVHGVPLDKLLKASLACGQSVPVPIAVAIMSGVLSGLHAAHETKDELGEPLNVVHRDVSPQNVIVGSDGIPRLVDFGIAKARSSAHVTQDGFFKGKAAYISPEQLRGEPPARTTDIYAAGVVLWELLVGRRIHAGRGESQLFSAVLSGALADLPTALEDKRGEMPVLRWQMLERLNPVVMRALALSPAQRYATAAAMVDELILTVSPASPLEVGAWVRELGGEFLDGRQKVLTATEESWRSLARIRASSSEPFPPGPTPASVSSGVVPRDENRERMPISISTPFPSTLSAAPPGARFGRPARLALWAVLLVFGGALGAWSVVMRILPPAAGTGLTTSMAVTLPTVAAPPAPLPDTVTSAPVALGVQPPKPPPTAPHPVYRAPAPRPSPHPPSAPTVVAPTSASPAAPACSPPFFFEGTKKVFKPGCV